jgi:ABC-type sugar transport system substrate-binding protein
MPSTAQQVGGAIGVAVIGVSFFGLLGNHAATVGNELAPRLRTELETAGMPGQASTQVGGFQTCFTDRVNENDPSATPPSCARAQAAGQDRVGRVVAATAEGARRRNFSEVLERTLLFEVAVFLACFLLTFLLPGARGPAYKHAAEAAAPA